MKMPDKNKRRKKKSKHPGLTDIKKKQNTVTRRLEKKVFKRYVPPTKINICFKTL